MGLKINREQVTEDIFEKCSKIIRNPILKSKE